jgi:hypothetical protein
MEQLIAKGNYAVDDTGKDVLYAEKAVVDRVVACYNVLRGIPTENLLAITQEVGGIGKLVENILASDYVIMPEPGEYDVEELRKSDLTLLLSVDYETVS